MLRALIFDVDGTLADTEELHRQAFNAAFAQASLDWHWGRKRYRELLAVAGGKERIARDIEQRSLVPVRRRALLDAIPGIHANKTRIYMERLRRGRLRLRPGVLRLLSDARKAGLGLGIATTTSLENVHALLESVPIHHFVDWFDAIGAGDSVEHKKPAPDIYNRVLEAMSRSSHECVAFEDSVNGLRAAKAAGLFTIVTPTRWNQDHDFAEADLLLPGLGDADHPLDAEQRAGLGESMLGLKTIEALLLRSQAPAVPARPRATAGSTDAGRCGARP